MEIPVTFWAEHALVAVGLRIAFDPPDAPVFHVGKDGAAVPASVAKGGDTGDGGFGARFGPALEIDEPQGKRAGGRCGSL